MTQKAQNRKLILQQLLHKSQLFNDYLKNTTNINSILDLTHSKKYQCLQFGKCQINLPQKVKAPPKFTNKIIVLTKNKKQTLKLKDKYEHLHKLRETQLLNLQIPETHSERKSISQYTKRQANTQMKHFSLNKHSQQITTPCTRNNPESYEFLQEPLTVEISPDRSSNISQLKCKTKEFIAKNRSSSAKVRPQFDFFLKNHIPPQNHAAQIERYTSQPMPSERKSFVSERNQTPKSSHKLQRPKQPSTLPKQPQTIPIQEPNQFTNQNPKSQPHILQQSICQQALTSIQFQPSHSTSIQPCPQRRSSSFSIKKHPSNVTPSLLLNKNYQQHLEQNKKHKINFRKQLHKTYKRAFIPPPKISAKAYAVYEVKQESVENSGKILCTINGKMAQEVASLTKIMTCIVVLQIADKFACNLDEELAEIGKFETNITGTSALLKIGQIYTVQQLLYGLMLPSGNDASLALGVWGGRVLLTHPQSKPQTNRTLQSSLSSSPVFASTKKYYKKDYIQRFVQEMNTKANQLNMNRTHYANTHGLVNSQNKSAAIDIALLCEYAMANEKFAQIVGTKVFQSVIKFKEPHNNPNGHSSFTIKNQHPSFTIKNEHPSQTTKLREIRFQNTHYLVQKKPGQYIGVKTGVTTAAGPCLASYIWNQQSNRKFIIVVLDCKSMMMRFKETQILKKWLYKQENIIVKGKKFKPRSLSLREDHSEIRSELQDMEVNSEGEEEQFGEEKCQD